MPEAAIRTILGLSISLKEATLLQDAQCDCGTRYRNGQHSPLCEIGWQQLPTTRAEAAANALAKTIDHADERSSAQKFGSDNPTPRAVHRSQPIVSSFSVTEAAHGRVAQARATVTQWRGIVSRWENQLDRDMDVDTLTTLREARLELSDAESRLFDAIRLAHKIAAAEASC